MRRGNRVLFFFVLISQTSTKNLLFIDFIVFIYIYKVVEGRIVFKDVLIFFLGG